MSTTPCSCSNIDVRAMELERAAERRRRGRSTAAASVDAAGSTADSAVGRTIRRARRGASRQRFDVERSIRATVQRAARAVGHDAAAERRAGVEGAERAAHRGLDRALDLPPIAKSNFGLGGMHVHVDRVRGDDDVEKQRRSHAGGNRRPIRCLGGARRVPGRAPRGHSPKGRRGASPCPTSDGRSTKPGDVRRAAHVVDVEQTFGERAAVDRGEPIARASALAGSDEHRLVRRATARCARRGA